MYKAENKLTKVQKRLLKNKDPVRKVFKKHELIFEGLKTSSKAKKK